MDRLGETDTPSSCSSLVDASVNQPNNAAEDGQAAGTRTRRRSSASPLPAVWEPAGSWSCAGRPPRLSADVRRQRRLELMRSREAPLVAKLGDSWEQPNPSSFRPETVSTLRKRFECVQLLMRRRCVATSGETVMALIGWSIEYLRLRTTHSKPAVFRLASNCW